MPWPDVMLRGYKPPCTRTWTMDVLGKINGGRLMMPRPCRPGRFYLCLYITVPGSIVRVALLWTKALPTTTTDEVQVVSVYIQPAW